MLSDKIEQVALKGQKPSMAWIAWVGTEVAALEEQNERLAGEPCSVCGGTPAILVDSAHKGTYWKCGDCVIEGIEDKMKLEAQLEESKTRSNNYWADLLHSKVQLAALRRALTDDGKLTPHHFRTWSEALEEKQRYESRLTQWLKIVADALESLDA